VSRHIVIYYFQQYWSRVNPETNRLSTYHIYYTWINNYIMMSFCGRIVFFLCLLHGDDTYYKCRRHMCGSLIIIIPTSSLCIYNTTCITHNIRTTRVPFHLSSCTFCSKTRATNNYCCVLYPRQHDYPSLSLCLSLRLFLRVSRFHATYI